MLHETTMPLLEDTNAGSERLSRVPTVGPLRLYERFSVGSLAELRFGWSRTSRRVVAVKRVHPHLLADVTFTKLLLEEAKAAMQLRHLNVVSLVAVVTSGDEVLLASEWTPGVSLHELLLAQRPLGLEFPQATTLVTSVLHGLDYAHRARGLLHRGLSPETVLFGDDGIARILGFGLARAKARLQSLHEPIAKWKLAYVSPEELNGDRVDARSDVYAAAVVLWEALSGRPLFLGPTVDSTLRQILYKPVPAPSNVVDRIPSMLEAIVRRGLARDPSQRFASAEEMARALEKTNLGAPRLFGVPVRQATMRRWRAEEIERANTD